MKKLNPVKMLTNILTIILTMILVTACGDRYRGPECVRTKNKALSAQPSDVTVVCAQP
jgi:hypothetical protein